MIQHSDEIPYDDDTYVQCQLKKNNLRTIAWIPLEYAVLGKILKLKCGDTWDNGWIVEELFGSQSYSILKLQEMVDRDFQITLG